MLNHSLMRWSIFVSAIIFLATSCQYNCNYSDHFYCLDSKDNPHVPLIKPYVAEKKQFGWQLWLHYGGVGRYTLPFVDFEKISIQEKVIFIHFPNNEEGGPILEWFVFIPSEKTELGFGTEEEMLTYLSERGLPKPNWVKLDDVWEEYSKTGYLPWEFLKELEK